MNNSEIVALRKRIRSGDITTEELVNILQHAERGDIEKIANGGVRHTADASATDYLQYWLAIARCFGYATRDDSWGELEKLFAIIIRRLLIAERNGVNRSITVID